MQLAAGKNDFTDKENLNLLADTIPDQAPQFEFNNKNFYHDSNKPGKIIEMSDRSYIVAPNGSWYKFTNEEEYNHLVYNVFKNKFM